MNESRDETKYGRFSINVCIERQTSKSEILKSRLLNEFASFTFQCHIYARSWQMLLNASCITSLALKYVSAMSVSNKTTFEKVILPDAATISQLTKI